MKLHFEPDVPHQIAAIEAVCDLFRGQEVCRSEFTVVNHAQGGQGRLGFAQTDRGIGNKLTLLDDEIHKNLLEVQLRNGLAPSQELESGEFTVEMETGTGKTYVYLRTIFELNKRYGFTKFVIVVPSVAIKEGVYHSIKTATEHFKSLYAGAPFDFFQYNSAHLGQVRNFATSSHIQIMVMTVQSIVRKDYAVIYKDREDTGGEKPIDLIRDTHPIVIIDEPQSVYGGEDGKGREAIQAMNPLAVLRYSATNIDKRHMVYMLDAVDAYEQKLVKQIEVAAGTIEHAHNRPYVRVVGMGNKRGQVYATLELHVQGLHGVSPEEVTVYGGEKLEQATKGRAIYRDMRVGEIRIAKGREFVELQVPNDQHFLKRGETWGGVDMSSVQREMIRRTIREHLDKEKRLRPQGIKVLSLFFIDSVEKYRKYDKDGNPEKGEYALMFEEEYARLARHPDYRTLFNEVDLSKHAAEVHNGYFSIDKKGGWTETSESNEGGREAAERAYNLIMKEKEKLLSLDEPLKFIFSHSALREGWDNPNVFQICTLREIQTERERRQTIGRGLRICVNQKGERVRGFDVNTLTVIATESYEEFAERLQTEIEQETGIRFGFVEEHQFAGIAVVDGQGNRGPLGFDQSKALWQHLKAKGYVNAAGKVQDALRTALKDKTLDLPPEFQGQKDQVAEVLRKLSGRLEIKNADERRPVKLNKQVYAGEDFKALWDRIKHKTTYRVHFDNEGLIRKCIAALRDAPPIPRARLQWRKADVAIGRGGVDTTETETSPSIMLDESDIELPDILTELQDRTRLTRRTICRVLIESGRLDDFRKNPQQFIETAGEAINRCKRLELVNGVRYQKLGDTEVYAQELFEKEELMGYLKSMMDAKKSVHEQVVYQSESVEKKFATDLENNTAVKVYAKLPPWFKIPTPLDSSYNPDWAVLVEEDGRERLYFVVESKPSLYDDVLRGTEGAKIACGRAHFEALRENGDTAKFVRATTVQEMMEHQDAVTAVTR